MTSNSRRAGTRARRAKVKASSTDERVGLPESFADALNAMELAYSSVQCSVEGCNVSPVRGRFCKAHLPRFIEDEKALPALCRALEVLKRNPEINMAGLKYLAKTTDSELLAKARRIHNSFPDRGPTYVEWPIWVW